MQRAPHEFFDPLAVTLFSPTYADGLISKGVVTEMHPGIPGARLEPNLERSVG